MNRAWGFMNRIGPVVLALAVFLAVPGEGLYAKTRGRGADLVIQRKDGTFLRGTLLSVRDRALILLDEDSGADVTVSIDDIDAFKVVKEPRFSARFSWTAALAGTAASIYGFSSWKKSVFTRLGLGVGGGVVALLGVMSLIKGTDDIAILRNASEKRTTLALNKLAGMSLFPSPPSADFEALRKLFKPRASLSGQGRSFRDLTGNRPPRFHLSFEPFLPLSDGTGPYMALFNRMGFGDTRPGGTFWFFHYDPIDYPNETRSRRLSLRGARVEYSLTRALAIGFAYGNLGSGWADGYRNIPVVWRGASYYSDAYISEKHESDGFFFSAAWMRPPDIFFNRTSLKLGVEIGACVLRQSFNTSEQSYSPVDRRSVRKVVPAAGAFGEIAYYFSRNVSLGVRAGYRYARARVEAFELKGTYMMFEENGTDSFDIIHVPLDVPFPAHTIELGGLTAGVSLGLHL